MIVLATKTIFNDSKREVDSNVTITNNSEDLQVHTSSKEGITSNSDDSSIDDSSSLKIVEYTKYSIIEKK